MNYDEVVVERDLDDEIQSRKDLIEEAKKLQEMSNWSAIQKEVSNLQRKWKRIPYFESALEDELADEFDGIIDGLYAKRKEGYASNKSMKVELIEQAKKLASTKDFSKGTKEVNDLLNEWKKSGTVGNSEEDDTLWNAFNDARQTFFDNKHKFYEEMKEKFAKAKVTKEEIIAKAKELVDSTDWTNTNVAFQELLNEWKAAGNSGKENDDTLWNEFNEVRQTFFANRSKHYEELHATQNTHYEAKQALVAQAKALVESKDFSKATTNQMIALTTEWKKVGSAGKNEDTIWKEFRSVNDEYFENLRQYNEQKQFEWRTRMQEVRARKQELLNNQKRQLKRLQDSMVGLISQREVDEVEDRIEDKKDFIAELEESIADIDAKLSK